MNAYKELSLQGRVTGYVRKCDIHNGNCIRRIGSPKSISSIREIEENRRYANVHSFSNRSLTGYEEN